MEKKGKTSLLKVLRNIGIGVVAVLVILIGVAIFIVVNPWPQTSGKLNVAGLKASVRVVRDEKGIPNIYAENDYDLFFAQGFVTAQDRLFQLEVHRRLGNGTLAEIVGKPGIWADRQSRFYGLRRIAEASYSKLTDHTKMILQAYGDGINAYIHANTDKLPVEFTLLNFKPKDWTPLDSMAFGNLMSLLTLQSAGYELSRIQMMAKLGEKMTNDALPTYDPDNPVIVTKELEPYSWGKVIPPRKNSAVSQNLSHENFVAGNLAGKNDWLKESTFSNEIQPDDLIGNAQRFGWASGAWAISGKFTATGKPILVNDVHQGLFIPSFWYEIGLHGGNYDVTGFSLPGGPFVMLGRNANIAWGFVNLNADAQDLYYEKLDDTAHPTKYLYQNKWFDLEKRQEVIQIKGAEPVTMNLLLSRHGVLANDYFAISKDEIAAADHPEKYAGSWHATQLERFEGSEPIALRWTTQDGCQVFNSLSELNQAKDWNDFRHALSQWDSFGESFVYADNQGNIGYQAAAHIPIRSEKHAGNIPVPGYTGEYEWKGYVPFEHLPFLYNPPTGFVATANTKTVTDDYPYTITYDWFHPGYRARSLATQLTKMISDGHKISVDDMEKLQGDTFSYAAQQLNTYLAQVKPENPLEEKVLEYSKKWDARYDLGSIGATVYATWYAYLDQNTFNDELFQKKIWGTFMPLKHIESLVQIMKDPQNAWFDDVTTSKVETRDEIVKKSFKNAVQYLTEKFGSDPSHWQMENMRTESLTHPLLGGVPVLSKLLFNSTITMPFAGSETSIAFAYSITYPPQNFNVMYAATQRHIVSFDAPDHMYGIISTGESMQPFHPHREDQLKMWATMEYWPLPSTKEGVEKAGKEVLTLDPTEAH